MRSVKNHCLLFIRKLEQHLPDGCQCRNNFDFVFLGFIHIINLHTFIPVEKSESNSS